MSHATDRILEQLQTQDDLHMQAANEIAQVVAAHIEAEQYLEEAKAAERKAFAAAPKYGWTQTEQNRLSEPPSSTQKEQQVQRLGRSLRTHKVMGRYSPFDEYRPIALAVVAHVASCSLVHSKSPPRSAAFPAHVDSRNQSTARAQATSYSI